MCQLRNIKEVAEPSTVKKNWDAFADIPVLYFLLFIAIG
jgi:hypothetical protein